MRKDTYERTQMEIIAFEAEDVIVTSGEEYEDDFANGGNINIRLPQI